MGGKMLRSGDLDRRLTIRRAVITRDAFNNPIEGFADVATVWASKTDIRDAERWSAHEVGAEISTRFQVRWSSTTASVNPKDQLICEGRTYSIVGTKEIPRRVGIEITAAARID